jgi:hypothetical protein
MLVDRRNVTRRRSARVLSRAVDDENEQSAAGAAPAPVPDSPVRHVRRKRALVLPPSDDDEEQQESAKRARSSAVEQQPQPSVSAAPQPGTSGVVISYQRAASPSPRPDLRGMRVRRETPPPQPEFDTSSSSDD